MKKPLTIFVTAVALVSASAGNAAMPSATADTLAGAPSSAANEYALNLAQQQYSAEKIIDQVSRVLDNTLPQSLLGDPQFAELEAAYPGLANVIASSIKPVMLKAYAEKLPLLWAQLAEFYVANLTKEEIGQIIAFAKSSAGVRYNAALQQSQNMRPVLDAARKADGYDATVKDASRKAQLESIRKANSAISAADRIAIFRFESSVAGSKLAKMIPHMQEIVLKWDFYFTDQQKSGFADARTEAIREFIEKSDVARTVTMSKTGSD